MADPFALTALYDAVKAQFSTDGTPGDFWFGWREADRQKTGTRNIFFVPGDSSGNVGNILPPKFPGGNARNLATVDEMLTIICDARDVTTPEIAEDERAQYAAARLLFDDVFRAIYLNAVGRFTVRRVAWMAEKKVRRLGAAIEVLLTIQGTVPDETYQTVSETSDPPLTIVASVSELDETDTLTIEATA